jgi:hypothetical protein
MAARIAQAYLAYMQNIFGYFETLSVEVVGYEIRQVLLLHASSLNADYFADLVRMVRQRGYRFVSLDRALKDKAYRQPDTYSGEEGASWIHHWASTQDKPVTAEPEVQEFVQKKFAARFD